MFGPKQSVLSYVETQTYTRYKLDRNQPRKKRITFHSRSAKGLRPKGICRALWVCRRGSPQHILHTSAYEFWSEIENQVERKIVPGLEKEGTGTRGDVVILGSRFSSDGTSCCAGELKWKSGDWWYLYDAFRYELKWKDFRCRSHQHTDRRWSESLRINCSHGLYGGNTGEERVSFLYQRVSVGRE